MFAYGFGNINNPKLRVYQVIFLFCGLVLSNSISEARFLLLETRKTVVERVRLGVRANNTGNKPTNEPTWRQAPVAPIEPKTYFGASVTFVFGPLILNGIGFDKFRTSLLNMPFGAFQIVVIFLGSYAECIFKLKSAVTAFLVPPVLILYALPPNEAGLLARYCLLTFLHGANPPIVSWISTNTAGSTKKSVVLTGSTPRAPCLISRASTSPGPLLFANTDAPLYKHGIRSCIGIFTALAASIILQVLNRACTRPSDGTAVAKTAVTEHGTGPPVRQAHLQGSATDGSRPATGDGRF
ncbi:hypothetical protein B0H10DRAFT_1939949 [Mycena sp. CBHHK59/15]|nr:hypothetical protein B0H10DRAFT_1939949 [Mycena sp. CBHHK59/15]